MPGVERFGDANPFVFIAVGKHDLMAAPWHADPAATPRALDRRAGLSAADAQQLAAVRTVERLRAPARLAFRAHVCAAKAVSASSDSEFT